MANTPPQKARESAPASRTGAKKKSPPAKAREKRSNVTRVLRSAAVKDAMSATSQTKASVTKTTPAKPKKPKTGRQKPETAVKKPAASSKNPPVPKKAAGGAKGPETAPKKASLKKASEKRASTGSNTVKKAKKTDLAGKKPQSADKKTDKPVAPKTASKKSPKRLPNAPEKPKSRPSRAKPKPIPVFPTAPWGPDSFIGFEASDQLPPAHLTSIAGGFVFYEGRVVLANVPGRGWEMVGGRIDIGESPEETFRREAANQVGVELTHVQMLGVIRIEHTGPKPPNCPYPYPIAYGVHFIGIAGNLRPFAGGHDSLGRSLISLEGLPEHYYNWSPFYEALFKYAFAEYHRIRKKAGK